MALVITEQITAKLVFTTNQRRNQVRTVLTNYLSREKAGARDFVIVDAPDGKYGPGPGLSVSVPFLSRTDADEAWVDLENANETWFVTGSVAEQFTSTEDIDQGLNETEYIHRKHWPAEPEDF